jgi:class 3 adenylate cyclase
MTNDERTIWIVDDEKIITSPLNRLIRNLLRDNAKMGAFKLLTANNPQSALDTIKGNGAELALVIADIMMPQLNGLDFLAAVKTVYPMAPRIVLTGYADKENAIRALNELDLFSYVEKPWNDEEFKKLVVNALSQFRQNRMEAMFRRYVPFEVIEEYIDQSDQSILNGKVGEATVLFLDIVDFTHMVEKMDARDVVNLLNDYFTIMVDIIRDRNGILDKFTGDGLMALFGMPRSTGAATDDARNAVLAALDIVRGVAELNAQQNGRPPIRVRLGVNSGPVIAGNIGSTRRVNYTAVSDTVNTASRIEDAARHIIAQDLACVLISQSTFQLVEKALPAPVTCTPLGPVKVKGKTQEVFLYRVLS